MLGYVQTESEVRADYIGLYKQLKRLLDPRPETLPRAQRLGGSRPFALTFRRQAAVSPMRDPTPRQSLPKSAALAPIDRVRIPKAAPDPPSYHAQDPPPQAPPGA